MSLLVIDRENFSIPDGYKLNKKSYIGEGKWSFIYQLCNDKGKKFAMKVIKFSVSKIYSPGNRDVYKEINTCYKHITTFNKKLFKKKIFVKRENIIDENNEKIPVLIMEYLGPTLKSRLLQNKFHGTIYEKKLHSFYKRLAKLKSVPGDFTSGNLLWSKKYREWYWLDHNGNDKKFKSEPETLAYIKKKMNKIIKRMTNRYSNTKEKN